MNKPAKSSPELAYEAVTLHHVEPEDAVLNYLTDEERRVIAEQLADRVRAERTAHEPATIFGDDFNGDEPTIRERIDSRGDEVRPGSSATWMN